MQRRTLLQFGAALAAAHAAPRARAQDRFPRGRPVTIVCPWAPGGITDVTARRVAQGLAALWGTQVVVDNRAGANGNIGAAAVSRAAPDGYTLMITLHDGMVIGKAARWQLGYDPIADLAPIAQVGVSDVYWTVRGNAPYQDIKEFIAAAKANPGKLNFGSGGYGSSLHLAMELLNVAAGIQLTHVPFRGGGLAVPELLAGRIDAMLATPALGLSYFQAGTMRPIALVGTERSPLFPKIPTIAESGYPDVSISLGVGVFGPKSLPRALVDQINADTRKVVAGELKARFLAEGFAPSDMAAAEYEAFLVREVARMEPLVKRVDFKQA